LFRRIFDAIKFRNLQVSIQWIKAHLKDDDVLPPQITKTDVLCNRLADRYAGIAAEKHAIDINIASSVIWYTHFIRKVQRRLVAILFSLPKRSKQIKYKDKKPPQLKIIDIIETQLSRHDAYIHETRVWCKVCKSSFSLSNPKAKDWLMAPCYGVTLGSDQPIALPFHELHTGNRHVHHSHDLHMYRGLAYCTRCGARGGSKYIKLSEYCMPPGTYGKQNLRYISKGDLPQGLSKWPEEDSSAKAASVVPDGLTYTYREIVGGIMEEFNRQGHTYKDTLIIEKPTISSICPLTSSSSSHMAPGISSPKDTFGHPSTREPSHCDSVPIDFVPSLHPSTMYNMYEGTKQQLGEELQDPIALQIFELPNIKLTYAALNHPAPLAPTRLLSDEERLLEELNTSFP